MLRVRFSCIQDSSDENYPKTAKNNQKMSRKSYTKRTNHSITYIANRKSFIKKKLSFGNVVMMCITKKRNLMKTEYMKAAGKICQIMPKTPKKWKSPKCIYILKMNFLELKLNNDSLYGYGGVSIPLTTPNITNNV